MGVLTVGATIINKIKEKKKEQKKLDEELESLFVQRRKLLGGTKAVANMKKTGLCMS